MIKKILFTSFACLWICLNSFAQTPGVSYSTPNTFTVGVAITTLSPSVTGIVVTGYTVNPNLPAGLLLDATTGLITGVPSLATAATDYTVTASTASGPKTAILSITITNPIPPNFTYLSPNTFNVGNAISTLVPNIISGSVTSYSVSPALPSGLTLDATTGSISGIPTAASAAANYTITATFGAVHSSFGINIGINDTAIPRISYISPNVFNLNVAIPTLTPTITGGSATGFSIDPTSPLPLGITLDSSTGVISGVPNEVKGNKNYVIIVATAVGKRYANLQIQVNPSVPSNVYTPSVVDLTVDSIIKPMKPNGDTTNTVYALDPDNKQLPDGLRLNTRTGVIYGKPTTACISKQYSIISTNINGGQQTRYSVNITVEPQPDAISTPPTIAFVGQGNIQQSLNTGASIAANTGIGVIYKENSNKRYLGLHHIEIDFSINVASTVDTIKSVNSAHNAVTNKQDFGNSVLLPLNSGQAFSFNFKGYFTQKGGGNGNYRRNAAPIPVPSCFPIISGFNISLEGSNRNWEYDAYSAPGSTNKISPITVKASLLSFYMGPFFEFVTPNKGNNYGQNASVTLGAGYSGRWILGDAQDVQENLQKQLLGQNTNSFNGFEVLLALRFYNIKAEVHLPFFSNKMPIPGLTGSHMTTFIGFTGGFPIDLTKPSSQ